jgi:mono/diheme cytochrome c family protein
VQFVTILPLSHDPLALRVYVDRSNPSVEAEPTWDSPQTRELAAAACFDCHSNETDWPRYSYLPPASLLLYNDVCGGRETLNFSEWSSGKRPELGEIVEAIDEGEMPPWYYATTRCCTPTPGYPTMKKSS